MRAHLRSLTAVRLCVATVRQVISSQITISATFELGSLGHPFRQSIIESLIDEIAPWVENAETQELHSGSVLHK